MLNLDFQAFMGPEGQKEHLFKEVYSSFYYFHAIFYTERFKNVILWLLAEAPFTPPPPNLGPVIR